MRCLGRLEASRDGRPLKLGGPKQRVVLAHLLIRANHTVPVDRLIAEVWDDDPPAAARSSLQSYVSHLRSALGSGLITGGGRGYALHIESDQVDALRFERLVTDGRALRATDPAGAAAALRAALDLWRGPPFADLYDVGSLQPEITRLEELRAAVIEERVDADLDAGRDSELIGELEALTTEHPLRERLWGQLMLALYRAGRQADALAAFDRARGVLADEVGADPSTTLRTLHEQVLRQDPALQWATATLKGYRLVERIGEGSFGVAWRATQPGVEREVIVKAARPSAANDPDFIRRFDADARQVARIEHPHVVPLYDFWREPDGAYLVLRYLRGGTLRDVLDSGPPEPGAALRIAGQLAEALAAAHRIGVTHRDVTPSNVLFDEDRNAYLSDFAIARTDAKPQPGAEPLVDPASAGQRMFEGAARGDVRALGAVLSNLVTDPDGALAEVLHRATTRDAAAQYRDGGALLAGLRAATAKAGQPHPGGTAARVPERGPRNPYKGLRAFVESDADDFFGRDALVARLIGRLRSGRPAARFLAVVGPSGSGKSSVVRAGLVPALRAGAIEGSETWFVAEMVPGTRPFDELAVALRHVAVDAPRDLAARLADDDGWQVPVGRLLPDGGELLLVVDQFEELFTLVEDDTVRQRFIGALVDAVTAPDSRIRVVTTLRADLFDRPLAYHGLAQLIQERTETIVPLGPDELERAVVGPAATVGVQVERPLLARIVADVTDQPGGLPLLQYALTELFDARHDGMLSSTAYQQIGGVTGALARRAEELFGALSDGAREAARQLCLQLVTPGEGAEDTRRRARVADVTALAPDEMPVVLRAFGDARLLSFDRDPETRAPTVEVAHEALLREWRRLRSWIDAARDDLRTHRRLHAAAADWTAADHDPSFLVTGSRLAQYETWRRDSGLMIADDERNYLDASVEARDRGIAEESARLERERELELRSVRRLRSLVAVFGVAALVAAGLTIFANTQARRAADAAARAQDEALRAERGERIATARELAAAADANLDVDPERSMLLAIEAIETTRAADEPALPEAEEALHHAVHTSRVTLRVPDVGGNLDWSSDGSIFVTEGPEDSGVIDIRDATTGASVRSWTGHEVDVNDVAFSPDGSTLATTGDDSAIRVWDVRTGQLLSEHVQSRTTDVWGPTFSPDGRRVAAVWRPSRLRVIDVASGDALFTVDDVAVPEIGPFSTSFSPDGRQIAIPVEDGVLLIDARTGERISTIGRSTDHGNVAWSPDGRWIAGSGGDADGLIYDARSGALRFTLTGHASEIREFDWSADATRLATAGGDGTVRVWDVDEGVTQAHLLTSAVMSSGVEGVALSSDGTKVMAGENLISGVLVWDVDDVGGGEVAAVPAEPFSRTPLAIADGGRGFVVADPAGGLTLRDLRTGAVVREFDTDGFVFAVAASDELIVASLDGTVAVWDVEGRRPFTLSLDENVGDVDVSDDGTSLATSDWDGAVRVYDTSGKVRANLAVSDDHFPVAVALNPDGSMAAVTEDPERPDGSGLIQLWDVEQRRIVDTIDARSNDIAFSPDGSKLAVAQEDGATVWAVDDATLIATLSGHLGSVWAVSFDADGSTVATTGRDGSVRLWDAESGLPRLVLPGHGIFSTAAEFSPDGTMLASAGGDSVARVWALDLDELIGIARDKLTRGLTDAECREYLHVETCPAS